MGNITTSGHNLGVVLYADRCMAIINDIDPKLDDRDMVKEWFDLAGQPVPRKPKLEWVFQHLDLGSWEKTTQAAFWLHYGWT